jgi:hypothetical protein
LPLTERDGLLRVTVSLNDTPRVFLVDTGARTSLITPRASGLSKTGLAKLLTVHLSGLGGSGTDIPVAPIQLRIGGRELLVDVGIAELPTLRECDGILGADVLSQFKRVTIDYQAHTLELIPR